MRIALAIFTLASLSSPLVVSAAQVPAAGTEARVAPPAPLTVSATLQPALDMVLRTLDTVRLEKWKRGSVREEANQNIGQIQHDIEVNLPPLLHDTDAAPGTLSKMLPLFKNLNALYDVLLRVEEASRVAAPDDQVAQLQQALITLGNARLALGERMQGSAETLEKQVVDLRATIQEQAARRPVAPAPVALPCVPPPVHRTTRRTTHRTTTKATQKKPATTTKKPDTTKPNTSSGSQPQTSH